MEKKEKVLKFLLLNFVLGIVWWVFAYIIIYLIGGIDLYKKDILSILNPQNFIIQIITSILIAILCSTMVRLVIYEGKKIDKENFFKNIIKNTIKLALKFYLVGGILFLSLYYLLDVLGKYSSENLNIVFMLLIVVSEVIYAIYYIVQQSVGNLNKKLDERKKML